MKHQHRRQSTLIVTDTESEGEESNGPPPTSPSPRATTHQQQAPRTSFYDEEYVHGQRVVRTTRPSSSDFDPEPQLTAVLNHTDPNMTRVRARIAHALTQRDHVPDFRVQDIPPRETNASLHDRLTELMAQRDATENDIMDMLEDRNADGTPLNPKRDYERAYHAASARHNQRNRDMWHAYTLRQEPQAPIYRAPARRPSAHQESSSAESKRSGPEFVWHQTPKIRCHVSYW